MIVHVFLPIYLYVWLNKMSYSIHMMSIQIDTVLVDKSLFKRTIFGISKKVRFGEFLKN